MLHNPLVSIIIATYNAEKTLNSTLESVLNQKYQNWECLIIDGVSKDQTISILKQYKLKDSRFKYISEKDSGIYNAFNKGWKKAKGEWILYLGSDDILLPNGIENLMKNAEEADVIYGNVILLFPNGKEKLQIARDTKCLERAERSPCCHQSLIMKKEIFYIMNGFDEKYKLLADKDLLIRCYKRGVKFKRINETISKFNIMGASQTSYISSFESYHIYKKYHNLINSLYYLSKRLCLSFLIIQKHKFFDK